MKLKSASFKITATLLTLLIFSKINLKAQQINTSALDAYWKITDKLRQGDTLSRDAWTNFLSLNGNKQYVANQAFDARFLENYRKTVQFVYSPKNDEKVKKMMEHPFDYWIVYKVNQYKIHEPELRAYAAHLKDAAYLDSMYNNAWQWLPSRLHTKSPATNMFFIGIDNDAIVQGDTIVFTLWSAYNQDKLKYGSLGGHELHHQLRKPVDFQSVKPSDEGILSALSVILNEGSADMVDKNYTFDKSKDIPLEYHYDDILLTHPDSIIRQIDTSMQLMASTNRAKFMTAKQYRKLMNYSSGHDPGYYMANIIVRNGFRNELIKNIQHPFYFVYLYNKAANKDPQHPAVFSPAAIAFCKTLEKEYWQTKWNSENK